MSTIELNTEQLTGTVRAYLMPREGSTGTPDPSGYPITPPVSGHYLFTVPNTFTGEFETLVIDAAGSIGYRGFVTIVSTTVNNVSTLLPSIPPVVGVGVGLTSGTGSSTTTGIGTVTQLIGPETSSATGTCSASGNQSPGYIVQADSDSGLLFPLPGGLTPVFPGDITPANDPDVDLSRVTDRVVLFNNPFCNRPVVRGRMQIRGNNLLLVPPDIVLTSPGIYNMDVIWTQGGVTYQKSAFVSVEQSLLNRALNSTSHGPLTVSRIRTRMRDWPEANDLLGTYEYSVAEIVTAILEPVELYNETPPHPVHYSTANFPYRMQWLDACCARLLLTSGDWMMRNQTTIQAEGLSNDTRDKYYRMIQIGSDLWQRYQQFVREDKMRMSIQYGYYSAF